MKTLEAIQAALREQMPFLRARYNVETLGVFGSYVRGEQTEASDLDLLVTFSKTPDLFEFVGLANHLEDALGVAVDLGTPKGLKRYLAPYIMREVQYL